MSSEFSRASPVTPKSHFSLLLSFSSTPPRVEAVLSSFVYHHYRRFSSVPSLLSRWCSLWELSSSPSSREGGKGSVSPGVEPPLQGRWQGTNRSPESVQVSSSSLFRPVPPALLSPSSPPPTSEVPVPAPAFPHLFQSTPPPVSLSL